MAACRHASHALQAARTVAEHKQTPFQELLLYIFLLSLLLLVFLMGRGGRELHPSKKCALGTVAGNRSKIGSRGKFKTDNVRRFRSRCAVADDPARRLSRRMVEFADPNIPGIYCEALGHSLKPLCRRSNAPHLPPGVITHPIIIGLQVEPEFQAGAKGFGKQPGGFRRNATLAAHDFIDALNRHTHMPGQGNLRKRMGIGNSSSKISPGGVGIRFSGSRGSSFVIVCP